MSAPVPLDTAPFTGTADVSSSGFIQFGAETTPGTPPGSFTWLPVLYAGTTWPQVAPDRQQIVVKGGSPNNVVAHLDRQSRVQMTLVAAMIPGADFTGFLAACGLHTDGTGFLKPLPTLTIVDVYGAMGGYTYSNLMPNRLTFDGSSQNVPATVTAEFWGIQKPVSQATASTPPSATLAHDPYSWTDWLPPPSLIGATANMEVDRWQLMVDFGLTQFYGGGKAFATRQQPWNHVCSGGFTMLDADDEHKAFLAKTEGALEFKFATHDTTPLFLDIKVPRAVYMTFVRTEGDREYITDVVTFEAQTPDWKAPVNFTLG